MRPVTRTSVARENVPRPVDKRVRPGRTGPAAVVRAYTAIEEAALSEAGIGRALFAKGGDEAEGARRPLRVPVSEPSVRAMVTDALELSFSLPSGSYATRVLAEVAKTTVDLPAGE